MKMKEKSVLDGFAMKQTVLFKLSAQLLIIANNAHFMELRHSLVTVLLIHFFYMRLFLDLFIFRFLQEFAQN